MMAGIIPVGITSWRARGDTVTVTLYASPDAFYTLKALAKGGALLGSGRESGFIGTAFDEHRGEVHGIRIGAADVTKCTAPH